MIAMALRRSDLPFQFTRVGFILFCLVLFYSASPGAGKSLDVFSSGDYSAGGRDLLQMSDPCPHQFNFDNFTNLLLACPTPNFANFSSYPKTACCQQVAVILCPWRTYVNDQNSDCASNFFSTLSLASNNNLTQMDIQFICTNDSSPNGIPCPSAPAPAPNHSAPRLVEELLPIVVLMMAVNLLFFWI